MNVVAESVSYAHRGSRTHAVRGASLHARSGEALGLVGPNGAGKSTLLGCILGFLTPRAGMVAIDGRPVDDLSVRQRTGSLSERPSFPAGASAREVLALHHALARCPRTRRRADVDALLERVGLAGSASRRPARFSHGMRQRLALACALLGDPELLILDEPATGLDPPGTLLLREELRAAKARGATIILSSHALDEVQRLCDRIVLMSEGVTSAARPTHELGGGARILVLSVRAADGSAPAPGPLREALESASLHVVAASEGVARVAAPDDAAAARAVGALVAAGLLVVEAHPEESPLERLFRDAAP